MEEKNKISAKELLTYCVDYLLRILGEEGSLFSRYDKNSKSVYELDFFDDDISFYSKILKELNEARKEKIKDNIKLLQPAIIRNLIIFLRSLRFLINLNTPNTSELYKDKIIKFDISLIEGYFVNTFNKKIIRRKEFFILCKNELESRYNYFYNNFSTNQDLHWKQSAEYEMLDLRERQKIIFEDILSTVSQYYYDKEEYTKYELTKEIINSFKEDRTKMDMDLLSENYFNNPAYQDYIDKYIEYTVNVNGYQISDENKKNREQDKLFLDNKIKYKKALFFPNLLKVDLNNVENCVNFLYFMSNEIEKDSNFNYDEEYEKFIEENELIIQESKEDLTKELKKIIEDKSFIYDFKQILNSSSVKNYLNKARKFNDENYNIIFIENEEEIDYKNDDELSLEFGKFKKLLEADNNFLSKLIIYKYLPKNIRAFVNPLMRININPLFFKTTDSLTQEKRKVILKSYLFIILIHEIIYLLKFMKKEKIPFDNIQKKAKEKEGGIMFINYLFDIPIIPCITYEQALKINEIKNWNNINELHCIFNEQKKIYETEKNNKRKFDISLYKFKDSISFSFSEFDDEDEKENNFDDDLDDYNDIN